MSYRYNGMDIDPADMARKFNETYIVLKKYGMVYVHRFEDFGAEVSETTRKTFVVPAAEFEVESEYPEMGIMVNYRKVCGLVQRVPRRQWSAGLTPNTLQMTNEAGYTFFGGSGGMTREAAKSLFFPEYPSIDKAFDAVSQDGSVALAFSPYYWMCSPDRESVRLYRRNVELGVVQKEKDTYILNLMDTSCSLEQELKDELKNVKFTINQGI